MPQERRAPLPWKRRLLAQIAVASQRKVPATPIVEVHEQPSDLGETKAATHHLRITLQKWRSVASERHMARAMRAKVETQIGKAASSFMGAYSSEYEAVQTREEPCVYCYGVVQAGPAPSVQHLDEHSSCSAHAHQLCVDMALSAYTATPRVVLLKCPHCRGRLAGCHVPPPGRAWCQKPVGSADDLCCQRKDHLGNCEVPDREMHARVAEDKHRYHQAWQKLHERLAMAKAHAAMATRGAPPAHMEATPQTLTAPKEERSVDVGHKHGDSSRSSSSRLGALYDAVESYLQLAGREAGRGVPHGPPSPASSSSDVIPSKRTAPLELGHAKRARSGFSGGEA
jgi:hypothetical protein